MAVFPAISGLVLRYKADSITAAVGSTVDSWPEMDGRHPALSQTTAAKRPTVVNGSNGHKSVKFDGTDDGLMMSGTALDVLRNLSGATVFAFVEPMASQGTSIRHIFNQSRNGTISTRLSLGHRNSTNMRGGGKRLDADASSYDDSIPLPDITLGRVDTLRVDYQNNDLFTYRAGKLISTKTDFSTAGLSADTTSSGGAVGVYANGTQEYYHEAITELVIFNRLLTLDEISQVHSYGQDEYGWLTADYQTSGSFDSTSNGVTASPGGPTFSGSVDSSALGSTTSSGIPYPVGASASTSDGVTASSSSFVSTEGAFASASDPTTASLGSPSLAGSSFSTAEGTSTLAGSPSVVVALDSTATGTTVGETPVEFTGTSALTAEGSTVSSGGMSIAGSLDTSSSGTTGSSGSFVIHGAFNSHASATTRSSGFVTVSGGFNSSSDGTLAHLSSIATAGALDSLGVGFSSFAEHELAVDFEVWVSGPFAALHLSDGPNRTPVKSTGPRAMDMASVGPLTR